MPLLMAFNSKEGMTSCMGHIMMTFRSSDQLPLFIFQRHPIPFLLERHLSPSSSKTRWLLPNRRTKTTRFWSILILSRNLATLTRKWTREGWIPRPIRLSISLPRASDSYSTCPTSVSICWHRIVACYVFR